MQVLLVGSPQYPTGQESRHVVVVAGEGCKKYPTLHSEHWSLFEPVQIEQAASQGTHMWFVASFQYPVAGQELRHVVVEGAGCRKYPGLQAEHSELRLPVQTKQEESHSTQILVVGFPPYPVGQ